MQKRILNSHCILLFLFIIFLSKSIHTFAQTPIQPIWQVSLGNHDHTSRDELTHSLRDSDGNLIIVGLVERDSTFGDIMVQKINASGSLVWQYRYSSEYSLNYDRPADALIDKENNIYILGIVSNDNNLFGGGGYAFKLNKEGKLVWERKLYDELPSHQSVSSLFFGLDSSESLHIAYTADNFDTKPSYFLKITANNTFLPVKTIPDIFHARIDQPRAKFFSVSRNGTKTFFIEQPDGNTNKNSYYTYSVTDTTKIAYPIVLSDTQQTLIQKGGLDLIGKDLDGNFYLLGNTQENNVRKGFSLFKILTNGQIGYNYYTTDSIEIEAKDMIVKDSSVIITGRFRNNSNSYWRVFIQEIDKNGQILRKKWIPQGVSDELVEGIYLSMGKLFLTIDYPNDQFSISELDTNFNKKWEYYLKKPAGQLYEHHNIIALNNNTVTTTGTLKSRKSPTNFFLSENDFYVESFNPTDISKNLWKYRYSDIGTSFIQGVKAISNGKGNVIALTSEQVGPSYPATGSTYPVSSKSYFNVINPSGQIELTKNSTVPVNQFFTDKDDNFITISGQFYKLDKKGNELKRSGYIGMDVKLLYVDTLRDEFYISTNLPDYTVVKYDKDFNALSSFSPSYLSYPIIKFFQLKNDPKIYYYDLKLVSYGDISTIHLYSNEGLVWKKDTIFNSHNTSLPYDVNPIDGSLSMYANRNLIKFSLNGKTSSTAIDLESDDYITQVFCMYDGNTILSGNYLGNSLLLSYNPSLEKIKRVVLSHEFHINYFKLGQFLIRTTDGKIAVFDSKVQRIGLYTNDLLYYIKESNFDKDYNIVVGTTIGQGFFLGSGEANQAYGWKWYRGVIAKFSLKSFLQSYITSTSESIQYKNQIELVAYPNPIKNEVTLKVTNLNNLEQGGTYNVYTYNTLGQMVGINIWKNTNQDLTIDFTNFEKGVYFIKIRNKDFSKSSSIVKMVKE